MTVTAASSDDSTATTAPSEETASPDAEATETPSEATTLGEFVSLTATKADTLTAVFDSAVPADATVVVENQYGTVSGSSEISDTTITFTGTANFSEDTYTMTVSYGDASKSMNTEVVAEYVASIEILSDTALTGGTKTVDEKEISNVDAYIYYEVYNQYGESLKETTTVTWTISSGDSYSVDKSKGRITVSKNNEAWTYGDLIAVVGVYVGSNGKTANVSKTVTVGLAQALDAVEFVGFLCDDDKTTIETSLPNDFAKGKWYLLYTAKDQQGNEMDAAEYVTNKNVTFVSDAPLLIDSTSFAEAGVKTVNSVDYAAVTIQPGTYVDKGGEVNITAISTGTGTKTTMNYVIGSNGILQSLVLQAPSSVIANGDQSVTIPYTATDTDGNSVTNYETIVRSSNTLTLKASEGTITISENTDGTAAITWSDEYQATSVYTYDENWEVSGYATDYVFANSKCYDGQDSLVSLTTVVVGGESNNTMISVSDARMPSAISSYADGANGNGYIVVGDDATLKTTSLTFLDQYGVSWTCGSTNDVMDDFFTYSAEKGISGEKYGIRYVVSTSSAIYAGNADGAAVDKVLYGGNSDSVTFSAEGLDVDTCTVTMYIVKEDASKVGTTDPSDWETVSKNFKYTFTVVPQDKATGAYISVSNTYLHIETDLSGTTNYSTSDRKDESMEDEVNDGDVLDVAENYISTVYVKGTYKGYEVELPDWSVSDGSDVCVSTYDVCDSQTYLTGRVVTGISGGTLSWADLYDANSAKGTRKDATASLKINVNVSTISTKLTVSDEVSLATEARMGNWYYNMAQPTLTDIDITTGIWDSTANDGIGDWIQTYSYNTGSDWWDNVAVYDQYGRIISSDDVDLTFEVTLTSEATTRLNHLSNSFTVSGNGSSYVKIEGAEIGDVFTLTMTGTDKYGSSASISKTITVGNDAYAYITSATTDVDKALREVLGYDR